MNLLMEKMTIKQVADPVDMNTAAITGARISLAKANKCAFILTMGDSTAAVVGFTLRQHTAASSGSSKDLSVANPYYKKVATATSYTKVVPAAAAAAYDLAADFASAEGVVVFEVLADQLDTDNGYTYVSVDVADSTAAKILSGLMVLSDCRFDAVYSEVI